MFRRGRRDEIRRLDPERDHERIVHLLSCYEFPWDMTRSLEIALLRTFCSPSISGLLQRTGEFTERTQKRYDDTDIIVCEILEHGYSSERGAAAIERMNAIHGRFRIANDDFLYVLSTFVLDPIRWIDRFGWRSLDDAERRALFAFWRNVGERMGIAELPADLESLRERSDTYENERFRPADSNGRIARSTMQMMSGWFPGPLRPLVRTSLRAMLDQRMLTCFDLKPAPLPVRCAVVAGLRVRAAALSCLPGRRSPRRRSESARRTYPSGCPMHEVGPA